MSNKIKNLNNLEIKAQDAEVMDIPMEEQSDQDQPKEPEVPVVKKNWFERRAEAAYAKRVERAEKKLQKAKEQPPKKTLKEKAKEAAPKILKGAAIVGGVGAAIVGGAIAYNAQRGANNQSSNEIQDEVFYDLDTTEPVTEEEPAEIEVKTEEAQEA
jgi:hypothetical protein